MGDVYTFLDKVALFEIAHKYADAMSLEANRSAMKPTPYGPVPYSAINRRPKLTLPNGALAQVVDAI